jgi:hypothetical protein
VRHRGDPRCLGEWGRRLELGSHRWRQWRTAEARVEARVHAGSNRGGFIWAGSNRGKFIWEGRGVNHITGACAAWAGRHRDVQRRGGQWRAVVGTPASGNWPLGAVQTLAVVTHSGMPARRMDCWVRRCLRVRARRAYGRWRGTRARRRAWARSGVPGLLAFH